MPSPLGHMLSGAIIGAIPVEGHRRLSFKRIGLGAFVAASPDLDMLLTYVGVDYFDAHRTFTHSIFTAVLVMLGLWVLNLLVKKKIDVHFSVPFGLVGACLLAHVGLDMIGADHRGPQGLMLLWPFSDKFYYANMPVFQALSDAAGNRPPVNVLILIVIREILTIGAGGMMLFAGNLLLRKSRPSSHSSRRA